MDSPRRWTNQSQPQTLYIAVFLLYIEAAFRVFDMIRFGVLAPVLAAIAAAGVAAGFGIANERKWGYVLGLVVAFVPFVLRLAFRGVDALLGTDLISLMFEIALVALLLHPQSRDYQRVWFK